MVMVGARTWNGPPRASPAPATTSSCFTMPCLANVRNQPGRAEGTRTVDLGSVNGNSLDGEEHSRTAAADHPPQDAAGCATRAPRIAAADGADSVTYAGD